MMSGGILTVSCSEFIKKFIFTCMNKTKGGCLRLLTDVQMPRQIERRLDWVFYKTEMKIWAVWGVRAVRKKKNSEQLLRVVFSTFCGEKNEN